MITLTTNACLLFLLGALFHHLGASTSSWEFWTGQFLASAIAINTLIGELKDDSYE